MSTYWIDSTGTVHADFRALETKARGMTDDALRYSISDATEAAEIGERSDNPKSGYYRDEASTYGTELRKRGARLGLPDAWLELYMTSDRPSRVLRDFRRHCAAGPEGRQALDHALKARARTARTFAEISDAAAEARDLTAAGRRIDDRISRHNEALDPGTLTGDDTLPDRDNATR